MAILNPIKVWHELDKAGCEDFKCFKHSTGETHIKYSGTGSAIDAMVNFQTRLAGRGVTTSLFSPTELALEGYDPAAIAGRDNRKNWEYDHFTRPTDALKWASDRIDELLEEVDPTLILEREDLLSAKFLMYRGGSQAVNKAVWLIRLWQRDPKKALKVMWSIPERAETILRRDAERLTKYNELYEEELWL